MFSSANPSSSKTPKHKYMDLISKLPDSLLCHILSFLNLKVVASTSILSKRWQNLWTLVPNLDISADDMLGKDMSLEHIMCKIFILREEWCIRKFRLLCPNYRCDRFHLRSWICATVARNVEELDLYLECSQSPDLFELPHALFSSKTLVVLKLVGYDIAISVASSVQLPSLKVLHLRYVHYKDDETVHNLFSGCPVLDDLVVIRCGFFDNVICYDISSPTLRYLIVYNSTSEGSEGSLLKLTVNAPALIYLKLYDSFSSGFAFKNLDNLVEAIIDVPENPRDIAMDVVQALGNVKFLELHCNVMKAFHDMASFDKLPNFCNLVELELTDFSGYWNLLQHLLQKCPFLKHLAIFKSYYHHACEEPHCWIHPLLVPHCVSFYLETVKFEGFKGLESEIDFSGYVLNRSGKLKEMTISYKGGSDLKEMFVALKKLSMFERGSRKCQLKFEEY